MEKSLGSRYVLRESLGSGAMGQVFAGSIRLTGEPVAIKILRPEFVSDREVVARFVQERTILMSIADPSVVRVIDLVVEGDTLAIVMELVHGTDLRRQLRDRRTVPPAEAVHLTGQLLRGVAAVHAAGIVHRDIKPENVLVDLSAGWPWLKLTDFGVARLSYGASLTKLSGLLGTPEYMAPELAEHNRATPAADIYSVGIVLYEMLCGRTPFAGGHPVAVLRRQADQAPPVIPGVPAELWDRIAWMLAKDPGGRPASAAGAYAALAPLESSLASWPALAPWAGPEPGAPAWTAPPAGQVDTHDHHGPAPHATVLRHRDRSEVAAPGGRAPAGLQIPPTSPPTRRKQQIRVGVLAVALVAILGLATTVALAATHHRPTSLRPAADGRTASPRATVSSAKAMGAGNIPGGSSRESPGPASITSVPPVSFEPQPQHSVVTVTEAAQPATPSPATSPASQQPSPSPTASLSAGEQQLVSLLNSNFLDDCTGRPSAEGGIIVAAVNCTSTTTGPTLLPLAELLSAGTAGTWFQDNTGGFTNAGNCPGGQYLGNWAHKGTVEGQLGCTIEANGLLRIVWVIGGDVGLTAEGSNPQTLWTWWQNHACEMPSICT
jgi:serine/threonine protein kinase